MPEVSPTIHLRAVLRNSDRPLLAGPVTLLRNGAHVGSGDVPYVGPGEPFEISFGSDDRMSFRYERRVEVEERMLGRDRPVYVHDLELSSTAPEAVRVEPQPTGRGQAVRQHIQTYAVASCDLNCIFQKQSLAVHFLSFFSR